MKGNRERKVFVNTGISDEDEVTLDKVSQMKRVT
jgi:hypothetical protein